MKRRLVRTLAVLLVAGGATWWVWPRDPKPWRVVEWSDWSYSVQFAPDGQSLVTISSGVKVIDVPRSGPITPERVLLAHEEETGQVWLSPDGDCFVTDQAYQRGPTVPKVLRIWDLRSGKLRATLDLPTDHSKNRHRPQVRFCDHGRIIRASWFRDRLHPVVAEWDATTGRPLPAIALPTDPVQASIFTDDGSTLVNLVDDGNAVSVLDVEGSHPEARFTVPVRAKGPTRFESAAASRDGRIVATRADDGSVQVWNVAEGRMVVDTFRDRPPRQGQSLTGIQVTPDGRAVVLGPLDHGTIQIRETRRGSVIANIPFEDRGLFGMADRTRHITISPDSRWLAVADAPNHRKTHWERFHRVADPWLEWAGLGQLTAPILVPVEDPPRVRLIDLATGAIVARYPASPDTVQLLFSPDSRTLAIHGRVSSMEEDNSPTAVTRLWNLPARP